MDVESIPRPSVVDLLEGRLREDNLSGRRRPGSLLPPERLTNTLFNAYLPVRRSLRMPFEDAATAAGRLAPVVRAVAERRVEEAQRAAEAYLRSTEKIMLSSLSRARQRPTDDPSG
ncbi:hypothetical protein GCM10011579_082790 [Streptomyces albiflavescens]|uniref:Uncharacterized protein n=1 Tax=Streptomyces albiflavescens TaxID=1623582 RepID=A0A918DA03_9ACTN|nr:hypothetical protein [Streptomyces albiflavescens]GGN88767.1 hypothetical protein GCM10011579_082790 [Streptomyces albiflavescens]